MLTSLKLDTIHVVLNTDCNAWQLSPTSDSPGVCRFCYRERNKVSTTNAIVRQVLDVLRAESSARRVVFTGGDPLMPYDNHIVGALRHAKDLGFDTNLHTNGLLLSDYYPRIKEYVDVYSLAIDGADDATANWFRGEGYFATFRRNLEQLQADARTLAFNTFTSPHSIRTLPLLADMIARIAQDCVVEYWLISQYRPIGRPSTAKRDIYGFDPDDFLRAVDQARHRVTPIPVFDQPTRSVTDAYPFRVWVLGDGTVTADLGSVTAPRNAVMGNLLSDGFTPLVNRALALRDRNQEPSR